MWNYPNKSPTRTFSNHLRRGNFQFTIFHLWFDSAGGGVSGRNTSGTPRRPKKGSWRRGNLSPAQRNSSSPGARPPRALLHQREAAPWPPVRACRRPCWFARAPQHLYIRTTCSSEFIIPTRQWARRIKTCRVIRTSADAHTCIVLGMRHVVVFWQRN